MLINLQGFADGSCLLPFMCSTATCHAQIPTIKQVDAKLYLHSHNICIKIQMHILYSLQALLPLSSDVHACMR